MTLRLTNHDASKHEYKCRISSGCLSCLQMLTLKYTKISRQYSLKKKFFLYNGANQTFVWWTDFETNFSFLTLVIRMLSVHQGAVSTSECCQYIRMLSVHQDAVSTSGCCQYIRVLSVHQGAVSTVYSTYCLQSLRVWPSITNWSLVIGAEANIYGL